MHPNVPTFIHYCFRVYSMFNLIQLPVEEIKVNKFDLNSDSFPVEMVSEFKLLMYHQNLCSICCTYQELLD